MWSCLSISLHGGLDCLNLSADGFVCGCQLGSSLQISQRLLCVAHAAMRLSSPEYRLHIVLVLLEHFGPSVRRWHWLWTLRAETWHADADVPADQIRPLLALRDGGSFWGPLARGGEAVISDPFLHPGILMGMLSLRSSVLPD